MRFRWAVTLSILISPALIAGSFTLSSSNSVLDQLDFNTQDGGGDSMLGELMINNSIAGGSLQYLNVLDANNNWVVQNLPIGLGGSMSGMITDKLNLPAGTGMGSNEMLTADLSATPTLNFTGAGDSTSSLSVAETTLAIGGTGANDNEDGVSTPAGTIAFGTGGANSIAYQTNHPNVEAGINQCAPAAVANSLTWLGVATTPNNPGTFGNPPNSLVAKLDTAMGRQSSSAQCPDAMGNPGPCGVWPLDGKLQYLGSIGQTGLAVNFQDAGNGAGDAGNGGTLGAGNYSANGVTAVNRGAPSFAFIQSELANGEDVEIDIRFPCPTATNANRICRHYVEVTGAGTILGQQWITHISDQLQGQAGGTNTTQFEWVTGTNGLPLEGNGAIIDQVISESTPEPGTVALIGLGLLALGGARKYRL
jgi:hypothetical protein